MTRADWLLILLQSELDPIRIQKGMFLFAMKGGAPADEVYSFVPYNWGPMSAAIYGDLEALEARNLVERVPVPGATFSRYRATEAGRAVVPGLRSTAEPGPLAYLDEVSSQVHSLSFNALLRTVYEEFPHYATKSLFRKPTSPTA